MELLIVVAVIGLLSVIAIPAFSGYRTATYNKTLVADLNNVAKAQELYFNDHGSYRPGLCRKLPGYEGSDGVACNTFVGDLGYVTYASHPKASEFCYYLNVFDREPRLECTR